MNLPASYNKNQGIQLSHGKDLPQGFQQIAAPARLQLLHPLSCFM